jgi:hypothetical protein
MKYAILFIFLLPISTVTHGGPFGLEMGTSLAELSKKMILKPEESMGMYTTSSVPNTHPDFDNYVLIITPSHGLCMVMAYSREIETSVFGIELIGKFTGIEEVISKKYGKPTRYDFLRDGSVWNESRDWTMGLLKKERVLRSVWKANGEELPDSVTRVELSPLVFSTEAAELMIKYEFKNTYECAGWIKSQSNSAL